MLFVFILTGTGLLKDVQSLLLEVKIRTVVVACDIEQISTNTVPRRGLMVCSFGDRRKSLLFCFDLEFCF